MDRMSRRRFLKAATLFGGAATTSTILGACGGAAQTPAPTSVAEATVAQATAAATAAATPAAATAVAATAVPAAALPFEVAADALNPLNIGAAEVDGMFFEGGYGIDYLKTVAQWMELLHPDVKMKVTGAQKIGDLVRPLLVAGTPPDVIDSANARNLDLSALIAEDQVADLAELMEAPALDTPGKKFKDTLLPGSQGDGIFEGTQRYINLTYTVQSVVYSKPLLDKYGYTYPTTWDEMATLCDTMKKDGKIAPWTYQAKYPGYLWDTIILPLIYKAGGKEIALKIDNLEPNAWKDPAVLRAIESVYMIYDHGWLLEGTAGMDHTQAQTAFIQGKAAFIPCGTWLENEMKTLLPADFQMELGLLPGFTDGKGSLKSVQAVGGEQYFVPAQAKNAKHGMEFLRVLLSRASAKWFGENTRGLLAVAGGLEGADVTPMMQSALALGENSGGDTISFRVAGWYKPVNDALEQYTTELMTGKIKPADFTDALQKVADSVAQDPDIKKFTRDA